MRRYPIHSRSCSILLALLVGLMPLGGCSFLAMRAPRAGYEPTQGPPECIERRVLPGLDIAGGITGLAVAGVAFVGESAIDMLEPGARAEHGTSATIGVISAALVLSSLYGFNVAQDCRRAHDRYRASVRSAPPGPMDAPIQP